jgi:hypothetical protein
MNFCYWATKGEEDAPSAIQKLTYTNDTKANLIFNLETQGPFEIIKVKTNTNAQHPDAPLLPAVTHPKKAVNEGNQHS